MACFVHPIASQRRSCFFSLSGAAFTVGRKFRHDQIRKHFQWYLTLDMSTLCGSRRRIAHLSNFSKNSRSDDVVLILFPRVQCPEDMRSMLPWAKRRTSGQQALHSFLCGQTMTKDQPGAQRCRTAVDAAKAMKQNASLISLWCFGQMLQEGAAHLHPARQPCISHIFAKTSGVM